MRIDPQQAVTASVDDAASPIHGASVFLPAGAITDTAEHPVLIVRAVGAGSEAGLAVSGVTVAGPGVRADLRELLGDQPLAITLAATITLPLTAPADRALPMHLGSEGWLELAGSVTDAAAATVSGSSLDLGLFVASWPGVSRADVPPGMDWDPLPGACQTTTFNGRGEITGRRRSTWQAGRLVDQKWYRFADSFNRNPEQATDNEVDDHRTYAYDAHGSLVSQNALPHRNDDEFPITHTVVYTAGRVRSDTAWPSHGSGVPRTREEYEYEDGRVSRRVTTGAVPVFGFGGVTVETEYDYDALGRVVRRSIVRETTSRGAGEWITLAPVEFTLYAYDDEVATGTEHTYSPEGELRERAELAYDDRGDVLRRDVYDAAGVLSGSERSAWGCWD